VQPQERFRRNGFGVGKAGTFDRRKFTPYEPFNLTKILMLIAGDKGNGVSRGLGPACAAYAMNVIFRIDGDIEIDDVRDARNIDAAGGDIGCNHNAVFAAFEAIHRALALALVAA
jgi:hypothetical protein